MSCLSVSNLFAVIWLFNIGRELLNIPHPIENNMATSGILVFWYIFFDKIISIITDSNKSDIFKTSK